MSSATLTPDAKALLARTVRELRERLLRDIHDAAEGEYRLSVSPDRAGLDEAHRKRRARLDEWLDENTRASGAKGREREAVRERFRAAAEKEAAATLLNRIVLLRHLEALGLLKPAVVTGGWRSKGYAQLRSFAPALAGDETEGYAALLQAVFDELALDLPGLFGDVGTTRLFPVPPATLREVIERLDDPALESAWTDDTTLGWVYQYWNESEREALDAKLVGGGKLENHEVAPKTQLFTDRYIVEWLLHNSLGLLWLCICKKNGWTADAEAVLPDLDARRADWRKKREAGEVALAALMPIAPGLEDHWKYFVPQPLPVAAVEGAPDSVRKLRILDPACGSGHFLMAAFDLLTALYEEETRHRGETWSRREIAESILENNLHGVDIDPRAIQIAAAGLTLKARTYAPDLRPRHLNLVASNLKLADLPPDDPALVRLRREVRESTGIPETLTDRIFEALKGADHRGSLLKVDAAVEGALRDVERPLAMSASQGDMFTGFPSQQSRIDFEKTKATVLNRLERFLATHSGGDDLGLRLDGEQLASGVRFVRMMREHAYDLVIGNPPYQGTGKMADAGWVAKHYPAGKADLFAAFLERGMALARANGFSALLTMRGWMFLGQYADLRRALLHNHDLRALGDLDKGAFETMPTSQMISVAMAVFLVAPPSSAQSVALQPTVPGEKYWGSDRTDLKRAAILVQRGRFHFDTKGFEAIAGEPIVYWWSDDLLVRYAATPKLGERFPSLVGLRTSDNTRFLRSPWECEYPCLCVRRFGEPAVEAEGHPRRFVPYIKGARGRWWFEDVGDVARWYAEGLEYRVAFEHKYHGFTSIQNRSWYFRPGVAFAMVGAEFSARAHRFQSIVGHKGASLFPDDVPSAVCLMNSSLAREILSSLNPGIGFEAGDVNRLPAFHIQGAEEIFSRLEATFSEHESALESSLEFRKPGPSAWRYALAWAQRAIDRGAGAPMPDYEPEHDPPAPAVHVSFAVGVALGRFGAAGEGILDTAPPTALHGGILFLSSATERDSLEHPACAPLRAVWEEHGPAVGERVDLRTYLRKSFFAHHKGIYENRPIYFPLSSAKKSFVAWISIHRWQADTLHAFLADHLQPERRSLEGELDDLRKARAAGGKGKAKAERRFAEVQRLLEELVVFMDAVTAIADAGPPPAGDGCPVREADARFTMDLDDGVMVNAAALWPLLEPQWKDPKKWWRELSTAQGRKDYDWSHLAARYFPSRVAAKCVEDPSLAVAHGCFWRLHPEKAFAWELRLQEEIRPDFLLDEADAAEHRARFLADHPDRAEEIRHAEMARRNRKSRLPGLEDQADNDADGDDTTDEDSDD